MLQYKYGFITVYSKPDWQSSKHTIESHACAREQHIFNAHWKWIQNKTSNPVCHVFLSSLTFQFSNITPPFVFHLFLVFRHMYFPRPLFLFSPHQIKPCHRKGEIDWWIRGVLECNSVISLLNVACTSVCMQRPSPVTDEGPSPLHAGKSCMCAVARLWRVNRCFAILSRSPVTMELCGGDSIFHHWWCVDEGGAAILWCNSLTVLVGGGSRRTIPPYHSIFIISNSPDSLTFKFISCTPNAGTNVKLVPLCLMKYKNIARKL